MIKDRRQKADALNYIVSRLWFPQLELEICPSSATSYKNKSITDIDVLAMVTDDFLGYRSFIIDCKTRKNESPINRALWLRGLMDRFGAERGMCIIKKNIERDHRITAMELGIQLLHEDDFINYTNTCKGKIDTSKSCLANIDNWDKFSDLEKIHLQLEPAIKFSKATYWSCQSSADAVRRSIAALMQVKKELDPEKNDHIAITIDITSLFLLALNRMSMKIFTSFFQPKNKEDLEHPLLMLIYGGRETYRLLNHYRKMVRVGTETVKDDLKPPEWNKFIQLTRHILDDPLESLKAPVLLREIAMAYLSNQQDLSFAKELIKTHPQTAKFALLSVEYLTRASGLPTDFEKKITNLLLQIQSSNSDQFHLS